MQRAIVIVDVQNGFINPSTAHIPAKIKSLLDAVVFEHRIFTQFFNPKGSPYESLLHWTRLRSDEEVAIVDKLQSYPTVVLRKPIYSCLNPEFFGYAAMHKIKEFYIAGIDTDSCVLKCAVDLFEAGFKPMVLADCCMSHGGISAHEAALLILPRFIGADQVINDSMKHFGLSKGYP
jgi:nicotinamidase-related amidase